MALSPLISKFAGFMTMTSVFLILGIWLAFSKGNKFGYALVGIVLTVDVAAFVYVFVHVRRRRLQRQANENFEEAANSPSTVQIDVIPANNPPPAYELQEGVQTVFPNAPISGAPPEYSSVVHIHDYTPVKTADLDAKSQIEADPRVQYMAAPIDVSVRLVSNHMKNVTVSVMLNETVDMLIMKVFMLQPFDDDISPAPASSDAIMLIGGKPMTRTSQLNSYRNEILSNKPIFLTVKETPNAEVPMMNPEPPIMYEMPPNSNEYI